mmetsp:Transcript_19633/g.30277  ORF Transcript_19633/g.30277 Transcript_19633/m.30277 type:complete len:217 (+) Transcript_19633:2812-3462(+)
MKALSADPAHAFVGEARDSALMMGLAFVELRVQIHAFMVASKAVRFFAPHLSFLLGQESALRTVNRDELGVVLDGLLVALHLAVHVVFQLADDRLQDVVGLSSLLLGEVLLVGFLNFQFCFLHAHPHQFQLLDNGLRLALELRARPLSMLEDELQGLAHLSLHVILLPSRATSLRRSRSCLSPFSGDGQEVGVCLITLYCSRAVASKHIKDSVLLL